MLIDLVIHVGLGLVLGILFTVAVLAKRKVDQSKAANAPGPRHPVVLASILTVIVGFVSLILIMKFARDYQPRSWMNLAALLGTWLIFWLALGRLILSSKQHAAKPTRA